jgi:hypothetical protein
MANRPADPVDCSPFTSVPTRVAEQLLGANRRALAGRLIGDVVELPPGDGDGGLQQVEGFGLRPDGTRVPVLVSVSPVTLWGCRP